MRLLSNGGGGGGGGVEDVECEGVGEGESARCLRGRRWVVEATAMAMRGAKCKVHQTAATGEMRCRRCGKQWRRCANNKLQVQARNEQGAPLQRQGNGIPVASAHLATRTLGQCSDSGVWLCKGGEWAWPRSHLCGLKDTRLRHLLGFVVAALGDHPDSVDWTRIALAL